MDFVASSSAGNNGSSSASVVVNKPSGVVEGDVMIASYTSNTSFWNIPSGWTAILSQLSGGSASMRTGVAYKVAGSSEPSNYTFTKDVGSPDSAPQTVTILAFRGVDQTTPIQGNSSAAHGSVAASTDPGTTLTVAQNTAPGRIIMWRASRKGEQSGAGVVPTYTTPSVNWTEGVDAGNASSSGNTAYAVSASYTGDFGTTSGTRGGPSGGIVANTSTDQNAFIMVALLGGVPPTNADAGKADPSAAAYNASALLGPSAGYAALSAAAHNAGVLTGVAAENTGSASVTAQAYNASVVLIGVAEAGAQAHNASVAIGTSAEYAQATVATLGGVGYFGAPESRRWRIPAEDRTFRVPHEDRVWRIPSED